MCKEAQIGQGCPLFFEVNTMVASSVTGVGHGDSNGKQKPELHSGCGCCSAPQSSNIEKKQIKKGCYKNYKSSCGIIRHTTKSVINKINSCF